MLSSSDLLKHWSLYRRARKDFHLSTQSESKGSRSRNLIWTVTIMAIRNKVFSLLALRENSFHRKKNSHSHYRLIFIDIPSTRRHIGFGSFHHSSAFCCNRIKNKMRKHQPQSIRTVSCTSTSSSNIVHSQPTPSSAAAAQVYALHPLIYTSRSRTITAVALPPQKKNKWYHTTG